MDGFIYEAPADSSSKEIKCQDEIGCPERVPQIIEWFRHTREPLNPGPSFAPFTGPYDQTYFSVRRRIERVLSLRSTESAGEAKTG